MLCESLNTREVLTGTNPRTTENVAYGVTTNSLSISTTQNPAYDAVVLQ